MRANNRAPALFIYVITTRMTHLPLLYGIRPFCRITVTLFIAAEVLSFNRAINTTSKTGGQPAGSPPN